VSLANALGMPQFKTPPDQKIMTQGELHEAEFRAAHDPVSRQAAGGSSPYPALSIRETTVLNHRARMAVYNQVYLYGLEQVFTLVQDARPITVERNYGVFPNVGNYLDGTFLCETAVRVIFMDRWLSIYTQQEPIIHVAYYKWSLSDLRHIRAIEADAWSRSEILEHVRGHRGGPAKFFAVVYLSALDPGPVIAPPLSTDAPPMFGDARFWLVPLDVHYDTQHGYMTFANLPSLEVCAARRNDPTQKYIYPHGNSGQWGSTYAPFGIADE